MQIILDYIVYIHTGKVKLGFSNNGKRDWWYYEVKSKNGVRKWVREEKWHALSTPIKATA